MKVNVSGTLILCCATLLVVTGVVHSLLGERRLLKPLLSRRDGILGSDLARTLLRLAWHLTSISWVVLAVILTSLVVSPIGTARWALIATGIAFTSAGVFDAVATRGRHLGWPLLTLIGIAALGALWLRR